MKKVISRVPSLTWLKTNGLILVILMMAAVLRLYALADYPTQLNRDEAALAINAHFLKQAGVDEWGKSWPLQFKSFGDYKLPGYIYLLLVLFQFSESDFMVRLPAAIAGIGIVGLGWLLFKKWYPTVITDQWAKIFVLLVLTVAPFSIFYSRMAWEANVGLGLLLLGLWSLWPDRQQLTANKYQLGLGILSFTVSNYVYNAPLLLIPFLLGILLIIYLIQSRPIWPLVVTGTLWLLSAILLLTVSTQKSNVAFFQDPTVISQYPAYRFGLPTVLRPIIGNKLAYFSVVAGRHFVASFSPQFLVTKGGQHPWHSVAGRGHLYWLVYVGFWLEVIWQLRGLLMIKLTKIPFKPILSHLVLWLMLAISLIPAIITYDAPHATRSLFFFFLFTLASCHGWIKLVALVRDHASQIQVRILKLTIISILIIEALGYGYQYFISWPPIFAPDMRIGLNQVLHQIPNQTKQIEIVDPSGFMYSVVAWDQRISANEFLTTVQRTNPNIVGLVEVTRMGKFWFSDRAGDVPGSDWQIKWDDQVLKWQGSQL